MSKKQDFVRFVQIYCSYLLKDDKKLNRQESEQLIKGGIEFFEISAPYTCMTCRNKSGLSFIEKNHKCLNPMFNKKGIPILTRVKEVCDEKGLDFGKIRKSIQIKTKEDGVPPKDKSLGIPPTIL